MVPHILTNHLSLLPKKQKDKTQLAPRKNGPQSGAGCLCSHSLFSFANNPSLNHGHFICRNFDPSLAGDASSLVSTPPATLMESRKASKQRRRRRDSDGAFLAAQDEGRVQDALRNICKCIYRESFICSSTD